MTNRVGESAARLPRLPDGVTSYEGLVPSTVRAIDDRRTPTEEAARLFGDRVGFLLALDDVFRQTEGRAEPVRRMFEMSRGLVAGARELIGEAWLGRARQDALRELMNDLDRWREALEAGEDPLRFVDEEITSIDREPDRMHAATRMARRWAWLHEAATTLRERRSELASEHQAVLDPLVRAAARWRLELEGAWATRSFDELLGEPTIEEVFVLVYPHLELPGR